MNYRYCPYDGKQLSLASDEHEGRPWCPQCGFVHYHNPAPCVAVLVARHRRILLARRAIEPAKGMWDIPGGFIQSGESAEEAAVREVMEETNLLVRITEFLGSIPDEYGPHKLPTLNLCFLANVVRGDPSPATDVDQLSWFRHDQLPQTMPFAHQYKALDWCVTRLKCRGG